MRFVVFTARQIAMLAVVLAYSTSSIAGGDPGNTGKFTLSAATSKGDAKVQIRAGPAQESSERGKGSWISSVEIYVGEVNIHVPRSAYADLIDPRLVKVEFKGAAGIVSIDGGDGSEAYLVRIFIDHKKVTRRTLSSALVPGKPTEVTRYFLRVLKDE